MVARMAALPHSHHSISLQEDKERVNIPEAESSDSGSTDESLDDDSADEPSLGNTTGDESDATCHSREAETAPKANGEERIASSSFSCCERCHAIQNESYNSVTPRKISHGRFLLMLEDEGTYHCSVTGLGFEVSKKVHIRYSILSWSKFGEFLKDSWRLAGPIFDVDCDPSILKTIHFPHALCLADKDSNVTFSVLHIKDSHPLIEPSVEHSGSHIKWNVTSLSPVGPIVKTSQPVELHGVVLVYKEIGQQSSFSFRIYLATNNPSDIKDIRQDVRNSKKRYMKIEKPPTCHKLLEEKKKYRLTSEPEGEITPEDFQLTLTAVKIKGYFEAFFEQPPPFKLSLVEADSGKRVWSGTIRQGDCEECEIEKPKRRQETRKRSSSTSEEEQWNKKGKWMDVSDGLQKLPDATDQELMAVAKTMGKEWRQVAISYLGLQMLELDKLQDEDSTMRRFKMLDQWRQRSKGDASVRKLHAILNQKDVPNEVRSTLEDMLHGGS